jgi:hypothetical protein
MGTKKHYGDSDSYERKLEKVMERIGVKEFSYNFDRFGCWVEFRYHEDLYRFEHSLEKAKAKGINLRYGSDAFAQVVLSLEDLARMIERGIYDLSTWVAGMKFLPTPIQVPSFIKFLGFDQNPFRARGHKGAVPADGQNHASGCRRNGRRLYPVKSSLREGN